MKIKLYISPGCSICNALKEFLNSHNIVFEIIDISRNIKKRDEIIERSGQMEAPIIEIDKEIIVGFDIKKISSLLKIK